MKHTVNWETPLKIETNLKQVKFARGLKIGFTILLLLLIQNCFMFQDAPRDNPLDPKNPNLKVVRDGLEAWWKFDGGSLADEMGRHNEASVLEGSGIRTVSDRYSPQQGGGIGSACSGSCGVKTKVLLSTDNVFKSHPFTIEFWMKFEVLPTSGIQTLLEYESQSSPNIYQIGFEGSPNLQFIVENNNSNKFSTDLQIKPDEWVHVAVLVNDLGNFKASFTPLNNKNDINIISLMSTGGGLTNGTAERIGSNVRRYE